MDTDWKQYHANESERALNHKLVEDVIEELVFNLRVEGDALARYGIKKVALYAAQVARAHALGFNPDLLRLTASEGFEEQMKLAEMATRMGKPVWMIQMDKES